MTAATTYRPALPAGRDGLAQLLLAEWTKLRSVARWTLGMVAAVLLTILFSLLTAFGSGTDVSGLDLTLGPDGTAVVDEFRFVHQPLSGDGSVTARVRAQAAVEGDGNEWARAGVMLKERAEPGSRYAAMMVTPGNGVRFQANFTTDRAGGAATAPRWLRLVRSGTTITGFESPDGSAWSRVGSIDLRALPRTVEAGLFVASPPTQRLERQIGSAGIGSSPTVSTATFDNVRVEPAGPQPASPWRHEDVGRAPSAGDSTEATGTGGTFTLTGSGDIAPRPPGDDVVRLSLTGASVGLIAVVSVSVLFITSEYKRRMIRTTLAASPRRGRVLVAKAIVLGAATFAAGLVASVVAFVAAQPILRSNGFRPPLYPQPSLADWPVLRAVVGTALLLALIAVLSLGAGAILRRSAGAIAMVIVLLVVPQFLVAALPLGAAHWLMRVTPVAGFAIQQAVERYPYVADPCLPESGCFLDPPLVGLGVLAAYAAATLAVAVWLLRRRDA